MITTKLLKDSNIIISNQISRMFHCKIYYEDKDIVIHECQYKNLKEIAEDLGLKYQAVADISSASRKKPRFQQFKYYPKIEITRLKKNNL